MRQTAQLSTLSPPLPDLREMHRFRPLTLKIFLATYPILNKLIKAMIRVWGRSCHGTTRSRLPKKGPPEQELNNLKRTPDLGCLRCSARCVPNATQGEQIYAPRPEVSNRSGGVTTGLGPIGVATPRRASRSTLPSPREEGKKNKNE